MVPTMVVAQNGVSDSGVDENEDHNEITDKKKVRTSNKNDSSDLVVGILQNQCKDHISDENSSKNEIKEMNDEGKHLSSFLTDDQNDSEEKILDELFNRKQLLLRRLSEEIHKYEQLCWDEMSPHRSLLQRNKVEISPTRNSLTDNLLDDNLESKKSWKWWRINKDSGLISNIRRRQSIGMIAEQYFRYFTNDKNGHSRAGSLPPTDSNACENETKKSIPTDIAKANDRKSFQLEQFLHFLNIQNQNGVQSDHLGTYPPPHHSYYYHQQQEQLKQVHRQPQVNEVSIQQPACILSPSFACPNQFQQVNCNHQRIRNFSGSQASQPLIYSSQRNQATNGCVMQKPYDIVHCNHRSLNNSFKRQSTHITGALNSHDVLYVSASSSAHTPQTRYSTNLQPIPNTYFYSLQKNHSSPLTAETTCRASFTVLPVAAGTTIPFPISTSLQNYSAPPVPPRVYSRTSKIFNHASKSMEESVLSKVIDKTILNLHSNTVTENHHTLEMHSKNNTVTVAAAAVTAGTTNSNTYISNLCKPTTRMVGTAVKLLPYSSRWPGEGEYHPYLNCINDQHKCTNSNVVYNGQFKDKIPPHQMVNGFHKTLELKPIEHFGLTHQLQQQRPPSKFISYHFTPNTYEFSLNHYNQRSSVVNRRDKFKCNENRGTNFIDNFNRNPSQNPFQLEKLVKEDSVNTMNVKLQPSQSLTNNFSQWPCKDKHINHEPFLVYQLNQPRLRNIPQREIKGAKNSQPVSLSNQTNTALSGCRIVKNPSSGWEINLGCACSKPVSTNYPKPGNFGQCWRPIIEPKETLNQNQSLPLNNPQDIQYSQAIIGGYYAVEKKIPRRKCQYESTTQSRSRKNHSNNSSNHQREHSYCPNYRQ
ncbi:unnamed protein product [Heterobilharzia americana]|nr:unnamed protein product [Heterobilharzia americana]